MDFSDFSFKLFLAYLIYYLVNILYDIFIRKNKFSKDNEKESVVNFSNLIQEETIDVKDYIEPISIEEKYNDITINNENSIVSEKIEEKNINSITESIVIVDDETDNDEIDLPIEGQAIPFEALLKEGKELFSNVNF